MKDWAMSGLLYLTKEYSQQIGKTLSPYANTSIQ